jgi:hypothetical protein
MAYFKAVSLNVTGRSDVPRQFPQDSRNSRDRNQALLDCKSEVLSLDPHCPVDCQVTKLAGLPLHYYI